MKRLLPFAPLLLLAALLLSPAAALAGAKQGIDIWWDRVLPALLIIGMASMITFQALCHMAINTGVFPVSGQPLPLVSKGGTSIIVTSIAFGVMFSVSRTIANSKDKQNKPKADEELPAGLDAENPTEVLPKNEWK